MTGLACSSANSEIILASNSSGRLSIGWLSDKSMLKHLMFGYSLGMTPQGPSTVAIAGATSSSPVTECSRLEIIPILMGMEVRSSPGGDERHEQRGQVDTRIERFRPRPNRQLRVERQRRV